MVNPANSVVANNKCSKDPRSSCKSTCETKNNCDAKEGDGNKSLNYCLKQSFLFNELPAIEADVSANFVMNKSNCSTDQNSNDASFKASPDQHASDISHTATAKSRILPKLQTGKITVKPLSTKKDPFSQTSNHPTFFVKEESCLSFHFENSSPSRICSDVSNAGYCAEGSVAEIQNDVSPNFFSSPR